MNVPSKTTLPPNRIPIAKLLARESATPEVIAKVLRIPVEEVTTALLWHFDHGNVERAGSAWRLTPAGREWLSERIARVPKEKAAPRAKAPKPKAEPRSPKPAPAPPTMADVARDRLRAAGLWSFVESFAKANGLDAMTLVGDARTQHVGRTRVRLYAALLAYPGRSYSNAEVGYLLMRGGVTVRDGVASLRARESKAA